MQCGTFQADAGLTSNDTDLTMSVVVSTYAYTPPHPSTQSYIAICITLSVSDMLREPDHTPHPMHR